jgi:predicted AAA+ superfamily ATPase
MYARWIQERLARDLRKPYVHVLFGARQTGKTTLLETLLPHPALRYNFSDPEERTRHLADPGAFRRECEAIPRSTDPQIVVVDEAQAVPSVFDAVQVLFDGARRRWRFVLCGSSARKLRHQGTNLLPGRALLHRLHPLILAERAAREGGGEERILPVGQSNHGGLEAFPAVDLETRMAFGDLPGIALLSAHEKPRILQSYATAYLEEEIRREAFVRDWGAFVNFLKLAARESGGILNFAALSRETGLSIPTVKSHYQLLEDMFVGFHVTAFSRSPRKNLLSTPRFYIFDLGVRHAASGAKPGPDVVAADPGRFFEHWVVCELWKRLQYLGEGSLHYLRTKDGAEIDAIVDLGGDVLPIEVKWTARPSKSDATQLERFIGETRGAHKGYVVCRCLRPAVLTPNVTAIPWHAV